MSIAEGMIAEFCQEAVGTRKLLERVPEDKLEWKPHPKSMTMGRLASHLAEIPEWTVTVVNDESFNMENADEPKAFTSEDELLECFDKNVELFKSAMDGQTDEHLLKHWKLVHGGQVVVDLPRLACLRGFVLSHIVHHRGQLTVYLREHDVPIPGLYGPSADEPM